MILEICFFRVFRLVLIAIFQRYVTLTWDPSLPSQIRNALSQNRCPPPLLWASRNYWMVPNETILVGRGGENFIILSSLKIEEGEIGLLVVYCIIQKISTFENKPPPHRK